MKRGKKEEAIKSRARAWKESNVAMKQIAPCSKCGMLRGWWSKPDSSRSVTVHKANGEITYRLIVEADTKFCRACDNQINRLIVSIAEEKAKVKLPFPFELTEVYKSAPQFYDLSPDEPQRYHFLGKDGASKCGRARVLDLKDGVRAPTVTPEMRCQGNGCRELWKNNEQASP